MSQDGKRYRTRQRDLVLSALQQAPGAYLTAREVADALAQRGEKVGLATVYRQLDRLVGEGFATRSAVDGKDGACYRFVRDAHDETTAGFFLKCEDCGELVPIECHELEHFYEHFSEEHHVRIDPVKTVLYGTCSACCENPKRMVNDTDTAQEARPASE